MCLLWHYVRGWTESNWGVLSKRRKIFKKKNHMLQRWCTWLQWLFIRMVVEERKRLMATSVPLYWSHFELNIPSPYVHHERSLLFPTLKNKNTKFYIWTINFDWILCPCERETLWMVRCLQHFNIIEWIFLVESSNNSKNL